jgi:hypothetical protein
VSERPEDDSPHMHPFVAMMGAPSKEQQEKMAMKATSIWHSVLHLLNEATQEQLESISDIIRMIDAHPKMSPYFSGLIDGILEKKFNICPSCERNHDEDMQREMDLASQTKPESESGSVPLAVEVVLPDPREVMETYGVRPSDDSIIPSLESAVVCKSCDLYYISLADRIRRPPGVDGCHGCQQKAGHG